MSSRHGKLWREHGRISNPRALHKPDEQTPEQQDAERAALSEVEAPYPVHSMWDCPDPDGLHCEEARRRIIAKAKLGIPGLSPEPDEVDDLGVSAGEPVPLVEQSKKAEKDYGGTIPSAAVPCQHEPLVVEITPSCRWFVWEPKFIGREPTNG